MAAEVPEVLLLRAAAFGDRDDVVDLEAEGALAGVASAGGVRLVDPALKPAWTAIRFGRWAIFFCSV